VNEKYGLNSSRIPGEAPVVSGLVREMEKSLEKARQSGAAMQAKALEGRGEGSRTTKTPSSRHFCSYITGLAS
jgi:hypothetical protein